MDKRFDRFIGFLKESRGSLFDFPRNIEREYYYPYLCPIVTRITFEGDYMFFAYRGFEFILN